MSEYQYYEFVAVDRALTKQQLAEVRGVSTRARLSATSFVNEYEWGDFKGDPVEFLVKYYDVHVYYANWRTRRVMMGFDGGMVDEELAKRACGKELVSVKKGRVVVDAWSEDEEGEYEEETEEWMPGMVQLRNEVLAGDERPFYLMWLGRVWAGEVEGDEEEPVAVGGLGELTAAQTALVEFLRIGEELMAEARRGREKGVRVDERAWKKWVKELPEGEKDRVLVEIGGSGNAGAGVELRRRFEREVRAGGGEGLRRRRAGELMKM